MSPTVTSTGVTVQTKDNQLLEIKHSLVSMMQTLLDATSDDSYDPTSPFPLPEVYSSSLLIVLEWCTHHLTSTDPLDIYESEEEYGYLLDHTGRCRYKRKRTFVPKWDQAFLARDNPTLCGIIQAANALKIRKLTDYSCNTMANRIRNKTPEEIRAEFNIANDLSDGEEDDDEIQLLSVDHSRTANYKFN